MSANINIVETTNTSENNSPIFLTALEVAEIFFKKKINYAKVLRMTRSGELPAIKRGKSYLYLQSALEKWAEKTFSKPTWAQKKY